MRRHAPLTKEAPSAIDALPQQDIRDYSLMCLTNDQIISYHRIAMKKILDFLVYFFNTGNKTKIISLVFD